MLVDAVTQEDLAELRDEMAINISQFTNNPVSIRVDMSPVNVGSVQLWFTGRYEDEDGILGERIERNITENALPYTLFGEDEGLYIGWAFPDGFYTLRAQGWTESNNGGRGGRSATIHISVLHVENPPTPLPASTLFDGQPATPEYWCDARIFIDC